MLMNFTVLTVVQKSVMNIMQIIIIRIIVKNVVKPYLGEKQNESNISN